MANGTIKVYCIDDVAEIELTRATEFGTPAMQLPYPVKNRAVANGVVLHRDEGQLNEHYRKSIRSLGLDLIELEMSLDDLIGRELTMAADQGHRVYLVPKKIADRYLAEQRMAK